MPRRKAPLQVNQFSKGLYTELNPLETSLETTADELNMGLDLDGSRRKRLGFDYEDGRIGRDSGSVFDNTLNLGHNLFRWENAGGSPSKTLLVVKLGRSIGFFDMDNAPVSGDRLYNFTFDTADGSSYQEPLGFANVDGMLVVATTNTVNYVFEYDPVSNTISETEFRLTIRDLFGTQAFGDGRDLTLSSNINFRPQELSMEHRYNLRNQGYHRLYRNDDGEGIEDMVSSFRNKFEQINGGPKRSPSNADNPNTYIFPDPNDADNRLVDRYWAEDQVETQADNTETPKGHFIIDLMNRGSSRESAYTRLMNLSSVYNFEAINLPEDKSIGNSASVVAEHAGRVWYAGFTGRLQGGDSKSPRLSSYVFFSVLVKDKNDVGRCYQIADPTSLEDPDLVATDGGFVRIQSAYNIKGLVSLGSALFVFAENGVWRISGPDNSDFKATDYEVVKVTERGAASQNSIVQAESSVYYWAEDGIYRISQNEYGVWVADNLTKTRIDTLYQNISEFRRNNAAGFFDPYTKEVRWMYNTPRRGLTQFETESFELIYNTALDAFIKNKIVGYENNGLPIILQGVEGNPFATTSLTIDVVAEGEVVTSSGENVTVDITISDTPVSSGLYLVLYNATGNLKYRLAQYKSDKYLDWYNEGITARKGYENYLVTNPITAGEPRSTKQVPYLTCYLERTEDGFDINFQPINASSCKVSARWGWADHVVSGKWSTEREAYRYNRTYIPNTTADTFETGDSLIITRSRMRGSGKSVAFKFNGENGKDMHLYGWAFNLLASNED